MATLRDSYTIDGNNYNDVNGANWRAQTFTASANYNCTSIKLLLFKHGTPITPMTVSLRATSSGLPTGSDLGGQSVDLDPTTLTGSPVWTEFTFASSVPLTSGTVYAIIFRSPNSPNAANDPNWEMNYPTGDEGAKYSGDSGSTWSSETDRHLDFEVWGVDSTSIKSINGLAKASVKSINGLAIASAKSVNGLA